MRIVISSGHGKYVRGAVGLIDEVDEARRVVQGVADWLTQSRHWVAEFHDDVSTTQNENLQRIVDFHNSQVRDLDISVHFNASQPTTKPVGTEVWYLTQADLAARVAATLAEAGDLVDRGAKHSSSLYFLNQTSAPAILIEVCFVDSDADVTAYRANFEKICEALGTVTPHVDAQVRFDGPCSWFGGPSDTGVGPDEGLAFFYEYKDAPHLFLPTQPPGTTGLARRLDTTVPYVACRWDYDVTPKTMLADKSKMALVKAGGREALAWPADWGPHADTGRAADLSPGLMDALGIQTDEYVEVIYPAKVKVGGH